MKGWVTVLVLAVIFYITYSFAVKKNDSSGVKKTTESSFISSKKGNEDKAQIPQITLSPIKKVKLPQTYSNKDIVIPSGENAYTNEDYKRAVVYPFYKRWLGYNEKLKKHPLYDAACLGIAQMLKAEYHDALAAYALKMLKKNKYDHIALIVLYHTRKKHFSKDQWKEKALHCTKGMRYHILRQYMYNMANENGYTQYNIREWIRLAMFKFAIQHKLNKTDSVFVFRSLISCYGDKQLKWLFKYTNKINPDNVWLRQTLLGRLYVSQAWEHRGSGWASEVTEEGWKGFKKFLKKAYKCNLTAWEMHKDLPDPAASMITIAMANGSDEEELLWFNRSVAAQADYLSSYSRLSNALRPRWCGSIQALVYLGDKCFETKLFNTKIPQQMIDYYLDATKDCTDREWKKFFIREGIVDNIEECLQQWQKRNQRFADNGWEKRINPDYFKAMTAIFCFYGSKYQKAQKIIDEMGYDNFCKQEKEILSQEKCITFVKVSKWNKHFSGAYSKYYINAQNYYFNNNDSAAIKLLKELIDKKNIPKDERAFAAELWGRYTLGPEVGTYKISRDAFIVACLRRRMDIAKKLLEYGINIDCKNYYGRNALYYSVFEKNGLELMKFLVKNGADINTSCNYKYSVLYNIANTKGLEDMMRYAIAQGAPPNIKAKNGFTPLMVAIFSKNITYVKLLVKAGAEVNAINENWNKSVLDYAFEKKCPKITKFLIAHGAKRAKKLSSKH